MEVCQLDAPALCSVRHRWITIYLVQVDVYPATCTQRRVPFSADGQAVAGDDPDVVDGPADVRADPVVIDAGTVVVNGSPVAVKGGAAAVAIAVSPLDPL